MSKVRICVIGAGEMSTRVHCPALASLDDVVIEAICDLDMAKATNLADVHDIAGRYVDYRTMIEDIAPDGVYAIGQPHLMFDVWMRCLRRGINLYIEKPMGFTLHQAQVLANEAANRGVITQVGHQRRSCPLLVAMRAECLKRGPITHAICEYYKNDLTPLTWAADHLLDDCVHAIDTLRWICGGEVEAVESRCRRIGVPDINWIGATLHFDTGATGYLVNNWSSGRRIFRVNMHAPGVFCDADPEALAHLYADGDCDGKTYDTRQISGSDEFYVFAGFQAKSREFIDSIRSRKHLTSSPFDDCVKTIEVAEKILANAVLRGE